MDALQRALRFPDYFGNNWNALDECICDLAWLPEGDVVLIHEDLPLAENPAALSIYLSILKDAVEEWHANRKRNLIVIFPPDTEDRVRKLLRNI